MYIFAKNKYYNCVCNALKILLCIDFKQDIEKMVDRLKI